MSEWRPGPGQLSLLSSMEGSGGLALHGWDTRRSVCQARPARVWGRLPPLAQRGRRVERALCAGKPAGEAPSPTTWDRCMDRPVGGTPLACPPGGGKSEKRHGVGQLCQLSSMEAGPDFHGWVLRGDCVCRHTPGRSAV